MGHFMDGDGPLWPWWASMVVISCCNFLFFRHTRLRSRPAHTPQDRRYLRYLRNLCVPFLFECAWRSVFPSLYNERQVLFDTPLNSILLDRSLAAIGEICWVLQICLILEQLATDLRQHWMKGCCGKCFVEFCSMIMALLAFVGEFFSFVGTFTTNAYFEVLEAMCWCSLFALASLASLTLLVRTHMAGACGVAAKRFMVVLTLQGFFYCPYMILYNIPMYWRIFRHDEEQGKTYLSIFEGIVDSWRTRERCQEWRCWRDDWFWMSFYFSFAVWSSICMMYAPRLRFARLTSQAGAL